MRILYLSDIHIEIREQQPRRQWTELEPLGLGPPLPAGEAVDLVVLAGDIGRVHSTRDVHPLRYAEQVAALLGAPVVLVPGNHEYYRGSFDETRAALLAARTPGVTVLDRGAALVPRRGGDPLRVLGATLWTDYALLGDTAAAMAAAREIVVDHRLMRRHDGRAPWEPQDAEAEHRLSRAWLAAALAEPHQGPTLVVTHHVPHPAAAHPGHGLNALSPAFCSDLTDVIALAKRAGAVAWIYGHDHWSQANEVEGVPLLAAQWGYAAEETRWQGPGVLAI